MCAHVFAFVTDKIEGLEREWQWQSVHSTRNGDPPVTATSRPYSCLRYQSCKKTEIVKRWLILLFFEQHRCRKRHTKMDMATKKNILGSTHTCLNT
mgnify:CR=1 FL=1